MKKKHIKLIRILLAVTLSFNQAFIYRSVYADETEETTETTVTESTAAETSEETPRETVRETTSETANQSSEETVKESVKEGISGDQVRSVKNAKEFVKGVSKLPRKYRIAAASRKGMPDFKGAEGVDYDGSCLISFKSKDDYEKALNDMEKKDINYSVDGDFDICSMKSASFSKDVKINPDAKTKVAIIDTGSDFANEKVSLLGDDGSDSNGHGTLMSRLILNETSDAYIISVKAVGDDGKGKLSDVYAGVRYAIDHEADFLLMAISLKDNGDYEEFISLIKEAITKGIKVIASAGNKNSDASGYIPAGIKGVITAGAIDNEGYKISISNYGSAVDYYIPADSTSEAAAILLGKLIAGKEDECETDYDTKTEDDDDEIIEDYDGPEFSIDKSKMTWPTKKNLTDAGYRNSADFAKAVIAACKAMKGASYGTGNGQADCMRYVNLAYAQALNLISGLKVNSKGKIPKLVRKKGNVTYNGISLTNSKYHLVDGCTTWSNTSPHNIGTPGGINIKKNGGLEASIKKLGARKGSILLFGGYNKKKVFKWTHAAIYTGTEKNVYDAPGGDQTTGVAYSKSESGSSKKKYTHVAALNYAVFQLPANVGISKTSTDAGLTEDNALYSLAGTKYGLYTSDGKLVHEFILDEKGQTDTYVLSDFTKSYYVSEIAAGKGYILSKNKYAVNLNSSASTLLINVEDVPIGSDGKLVIEKKDPEGWDKVTGHGMDEAKFRVDYYDSFAIESYKDLDTVEDDPLKPKASVTIGSSRKLESSAEFEISAEKLKAADKSGYFSKFKGTKLPVGTYVITETKAPEGYKITDPSKPLIMKIQQEGESTVTYYSADPTIYKILEDKILLNEEVILGQGLFTKKIDIPENINADTRLYSPERTTYLITHKSSGKPAATLVFGKDGRVSEVIYPDGVDPRKKITEDGLIPLPAGEYSAKEVHSGYGLYLNTEEKTFTVTENSTAELRFTDEPVFSMFDLLIKKVKSNSLSDQVIAMIPVGDAEFTLSYYAAFYEDDSYKDKKPDRTWILRSDDEGKVAYDIDHFVSGDDLFTDSEGNYIVTQGTYVITESKAPAGTEISTESKVIVVRFPKDIVRGSDNDPAKKKASESTMFDNNLEDVKEGKIEYYNDYKTQITTTAVSTASGSKEIAAVKGVGITDTLTYKNLLPGYQYKIRAWLIKSDGSNISEPFDTALMLRASDKRDGTLNITFTIDASVLKGETITVMEDLYIIDLTGAEHLYLSHADIDNKDQQVTVPDIKTELIDRLIDEFNNNENSKIVSYGKDVTITDYVTYRNLIPGKKYKVSGTLLDKETGKPLVNSKGKAITATKEFTPEKSEGVITVEFEHVDTTVFKGSVVAGEILNSDGVDLITHFDLSDEDQTVRPVKIKTTASDSNNKTKTLNYSETVDITDMVTYTGLKEGKTYKITAVLMDKSTGKEYLDSEGNKYEKTMEFNAKTSDGIIEVRFEKVKLSFEYKELVVFERLTDTKNDATVAVHEDINDKDQTVFRPQASTAASSSKGTKTINEDTGNAKISDKVMYKGLTSGNTYCAVATLYKTDGTQIQIDGKPVSSKVTFTPKKSDGTIEVPLTFNVDSLSYGESVVIFENLFDVATEEEKQDGTQLEDIEIVRHNDLNNKNQTLKYKIPVIPKTGEETSPALIIGLLLVGASAGPAGFAIRVKRGVKCRVPQRSQRKPDVSSLWCSLKRRMRDGSSRVWRNLNP